MGIEDESNLSQPDFCEKTKKLNMSTTRVEFTQIEAHHFTFELPTHVAEWYKTNRPGEEPDLTFKDDCWEVTWGEEDTVLRISKGCEQVERMELDHLEYTEIDEAELRKKLEFWEKQAKRLEAKLDEVKKVDEHQIDREIIDRLELDY
tara:strand:- start:2524 stop:2967 length:444 start_codon:yes stop_codon:yes gene_type:complete